MTIIIPLITIIEGRTYNVILLVVIVQTATFSYAVKAVAASFKFLGKQQLLTVFNIVINKAIIPRITVYEFAFFNTILTG